MSHRNRRNLVRIAALLALLSVPTDARAGDFNGDGADDLVIGAPNATIFTTQNIGEVHVLYGVLGAGPSTFKTQLITPVALEPGLGLADLQNTFFALGVDVACGDFNTDGFDDLAISAPFADVGKATAAGRIYVLSGSPDGLVIDTRKVLHQNVKGVKSKAKAGELFGFRMTCGDFDGDGYADLATSSVETVGKVEGAGAVQIFYGSKKGLRAKRNQFIHEKTKGVPGDPASPHYFGAGLCAGDLNGDGRDELVVCTPFALDANLNVSDYTILKGTKKGLTGKGALRLTISQFGGESGELQFGTPACGDFDNDGFDDLALGWAHGGAGITPDAGAFVELRGGPNGVDSNAFTIWHQGSIGILGTNATGDRFATNLIAADFNGDGFADLAIGSPGDADSGVTDGGTAAVIYGSASGLSTTDQLFHQDTPGIADMVEAGDEFGSAIGAGDFDGNGVFDLVIGVPEESVNGVSGAGVVHVLQGFMGTGLDPLSSSYWHKDVVGVPGTPAANDGFGTSIGH